jgi:hypothetical protein
MIACTVRWLSAVSALACTSCAPTLDHQLSTRQYGEALCSLGPSAEGQSVAARERVLAAIVRDADPELLVRAVTETELRSAIGPRASDFHRDFVVVILAFRSTDLSVQRATAVRFVAQGARLPMIEADDRAFAGAFGERLPGDETFVAKEGRLSRLARALAPTPDKSVGAAVGGVATGLLELFTLGIVPFTEIFPGRGPDRVTVVHPTDAQIHAAAPATMAIADGLRAALRDVPTGWHPRVLLLDRPAPGAGSAPPAIEVELAFTQSSHASVRCEGRMLYEVPLAPAPTFEASVARAFPTPGAVGEAGNIGGPRRLLEIARRKPPVPTP